MITLNTAGKSVNEALVFIKNSLKNDENELKIIIGEPFDVSKIKDFLETQGFDNILPEDDDGVLCLIASKKSASAPEIKIEPEKSEPEISPAKIEIENKEIEFENKEIEFENENIEIESENENESENIQPAKTPVISNNIIIKNSTGILISCKNKKFPDFFLTKFIISLSKSKIKPTLIAIINNAVKIAAYNSQTCDYLKQLENDGVKILISDSCADRLGITEVIGAGILTDMSEILEEIFMCENTLSI